MRKLIAAAALLFVSATYYPLVNNAGQIQLLPSASTLLTQATSTSGASINLPPGTAPTSPNNGDCWTTSSGLFCQIAGLTVGPYGTGSGSGNVTGSSLTSGDVVIGGGGSSISVDTNASLSAGALTLGASGTAGSIVMGNATSGTVTVKPVTGALGTVTASIPANTGTVAELNLSQSFTAGQAVTPVAEGTQSAGGTLTMDFSAGNHHTATFGAGNLTIANPSNIKAGECGFLALTQDGVGSRTVTWGSDFKWAGGSAPTLSTSPNAVDLINWCTVTTSVIVATLSIKGYQ